KISEQVERLQGSGEDVCAVYSDAFLIDENGDDIKGQFIERYVSFKELPTGDIYGQLLVKNFVPAMSLLVKRQCYNEVGMFDESLVYEDYDMWLRLARKYKFIVSDAINVRYRIRSNSLLNTIKNINIPNIYILSKHLPHPKAIEHLERIGQIFF